VIFAGAADHFLEICNNKTGCTTLQKVRGSA
jgi:hypothetical protein